MDFGSEYDDIIQDAILEIHVKEHENVVKVLHNIFYNDAIELPGGDVVISKSIVDYYKHFVSKKLSKLDEGIRIELDEKATKDYQEIICRVVSKVRCEMSA